ncbi:glycosyltransferase [bacterium]|nr:glycosyltransferase [bacterium]
MNSSPKRIFYLITDLDIGGAEKMLFELVKRIDKDKFMPEVGCLKGKGIVGKKLEALGIKVRCFHIEKPWHIYKLLGISFFLKQGHFDILHSYLFHANIIGRVCGRMAGIPIIISSIRVCEKKKLYHLWMDRITNWMVNLEICVSKGVKNFTIEKAGIPEHKLKIVENGIPDSFLDAVTSYRNKKAHSLIVGTVARLSEQKGIEYLLYASERVIKQFPDITFIIAGKGPLASQLEELSGKLNISRNVKFIGFRKDIPELLSVIDIFVLPSLWEGMPNVVLEAMAAGKPAIATDTGGSKDIIDNNINGVLVEPENSEALAEAILKLLKNPDERERLGKAAEQRVKEKFPIDKMVSKTEQIYTRLLNLSS